MNFPFIQRVYETMACGVREEYKVPGVEDAFAPGSFCLGWYKEALDAYKNICRRLGLSIEEDEDVEAIFSAFSQIQEELCYRMYRYGAQFGMQDDPDGTILSVHFFDPPDQK